METALMHLRAGGGTSPDSSYLLLGMIGGGGRGLKFSWRGCRWPWEASVLPSGSGALGGLPMGPGREPRRALIRPRPRRWCDVARPAARSAPISRVCSGDGSDGGDPARRRGALPAERVAAADGSHSAVGVGGEAALYKRRGSEAGGSGGRRDPRPHSGLVGGPVLVSRAGRRGSGGGWRRRPGRFPILPIRAREPWKH